MVAHLAGSAAEVAGGVAGIVVDVIAHLAGGAAEVAGSITGVVVGVSARRNIGEIVHRAGLTLVQRQGAAGGGGVAGVAVGAVAAQIGVDALILVAQVDKLVGRGAAHRPLGVVGDRRQQSALILGAVAAGIYLGRGVVQRPIVAVLSDLPHQVGGRILHGAGGGGHLGIIQTIGITYLRLQRAVAVHDEVIALGQLAAVGLVGVAVAHAAIFAAGVQGIEGHPRGDGQRTARRVIGGLVGGLAHLGGTPAQEGLAVGHRTAVGGEGDGIAGIGGLGGGDATRLHKLHGPLLPRAKVDAHRHVGGGRHGEGVAIALYGGVTGQDGVAGGLVAGLGAGGDDAALHRHGAVVGVVGGGGDGVTHGSALARGGVVAVGHLLVKQQEGQLGIVHEHVAGAGDGLDRVVTAQLPGIYGVFLHPLE